MFIHFYCGKCGQYLTWCQQSHDSGEFKINKANLNCYKCKNDQKTIKVKYHRG